MRYTKPVGVCSENMFGLDASDRCELLVIGEEAGEGVGEVGGEEEDESEDCPFSLSL